MTAGYLSPQRREALRLLRERRAAAGAPVEVPAAGPAVLSPGQRRLWFFEQLRPGHPLYHVAGGVRLRGPLDPAALRRALTDVVRRHDALRTTYRPGADGDAIGEVRDPAGVDLPVEDAADPTARARELAVAPLDLATSPVRFALLRSGPEDHLLVVVLHHLAADGWSLGVLLHELVATYAGAGPLPALPVRYADWARSQDARLPAVLEEHLPFWTTALAGAAALELPTDRPRPARSAHTGAVATLHVPGGAERLAAVAGAARTTPFSVALAVVAAVLSRWSGQADVLLGVPAAGRDRPELAGMVGFLVNTLPVRLDLSGRPTVAALAGAAGRAVLDAQAHGEVPYDVLVEKAGPLVRHLVQYDPEPAAPVRLGPLELELEPLDTGTAKFDLELFLAPTADGSLTGRVEYSTELFDATSVAALLGALEHALAGAAPDLPVDDLPLLPGPEVGPTGTPPSPTTAPDGPPAPSAAEPTVHGLVAAQAARTPDLVAVEYEGVTRTYRELDDAAGRLACVLAARGVGRGDLVGIRLRRGPDLLTALLGVLRAGAAYLPLDPDLPPARIEQMRADAAAAVTVTEGGDGEVDLVRDAAELAAAPVVARAPAGARDLAYVIFTSGSTGRPKGAMNEHRAVVNRLLWMQEAFGLEPGEGVLQKTPLGFDVSVWELFWPLVVGARCVLVPPDAHRDPAQLAEVIARADVTTVHFVPSMLAQFVPMAPAGLPLRRLVCSGEELTADLVDQVARWSPDLPVFNLYGPAEAAVDVSWHRAVPGAGPRVPIGVPIAGAALHVVDPRLRPVPAGMLGELLIGGVAVGRGYRDRPGLTAERFVPDPYGPPGGRLYRTGDLVRELPDGTLEYRGRIDTQVKIRGMRVEPGEAEAVLAGHPLVDSVVVDPRPGPDGLRLVAWIRTDSPVAAWRDHLGAPATPPTDTPAPEPTELGRVVTPYLRSWLRQRLPAHLVPDQVVVVEEWPLSPNGKLDRRLLPEPAPGRPDVPYVAPGNDLERRLAAIWAELLGVEQVGAADDFFELGGHSLLAVRVVARLKADLGVDVRLADLFAAPTLSAMAAAVTAAGTARPGPAPVRRVDRRRYRVPEGET